VVERLPVSPLDAGAQRIQALRAELSRQPDNLSLATRLAWLYIEAGRGLSDPRYYGYAQGTLSPWWTADDPPVPVLVLRATIRQHDHDFAGALRDLEKAVRADPSNAQAWLTQATVLQVRGDYAAAKRSCLEVLQLANPLVAVACLSNVDSLNGAAPKSYEVLRRALARTPNAEVGVHRWALTTLAEIAVRTGQPEVAEKHFRQALSLGRADHYLLAAYADFLLDQGRPEAVRELLADATRADGLLLRLALAEQALADPDLDLHVQALRDRFAAARRRGDSAHQREEARFTLRLLGQPDTALQLARDNWEVQREPSDVRILLESALASGDDEAARPALEFLDRTGLEDVRLAQLSTQARRSPQ
jgi:tetratricopeptide (TPR) repeat protein